jgi:hypothetical protein
MGRALRPTKRVSPRKVRVGDVVLLRTPHAKNNRWFAVDYVGQHTPPYVWSGRWVFGADAGVWTILNATDETYVVKDPRDAARDQAHLRALPRSAQV